MVIKTNKSGETFFFSKKIIIFKNGFNGYFQCTCELENNLSKSSIFGDYICEDGDTLNCGGGRYVRSYVISDK